MAFSATRWECTVRNQSFPNIKWDSTTGSSPPDHQADFGCQRQTNEATSLDRILPKTERAGIRTDWRHQPCFVHYVAFALTSIPGITSGKQARQCACPHLVCCDSRHRLHRGWCAVDCSKHQGVNLGEGGASTEVKSRFRRV